MDHLSYDLVEEVASYLPRPELETIARVATRSPALNNWSIASEDQLERRFLLQVCVHMQGYDEGEKEVERSPRIRVSALKLLSHGPLEEWDFKNWRYAWIHDVHITASLRNDLSVLETPPASVLDSPGLLHAPEETFKESNIHQVLRVVSLPVDPSPWSCLSIEYDCNSSTPRNLLELFWKTVEKTRKEFASVFVQNMYGHRLDAFRGFIADSIERGAFLDCLSYYDEWSPMRGICEVIAPVFGKRRGRPLTVSLPCDVLDAEDGDLIIDAWLESDGTFEEKKFTCGELEATVPWITVNEKYKALTLGKSTWRYLAHPTKRSSLFIGYYEFRVVKFEPWHVPVDFQWIDSLIDKWREECGFCVWKGWMKLFFKFKEADDWEKLLEKYGPAVNEGNRLPIAHPTGTTFLEVTKSDDWFEIELKYEFYTKQKLESLISEWKKGSGETLANGLTKMHVELAEDLVEDFVKGLSVTPQYSHPLGNTRCLIFLTLLQDDPEYAPVFCISIVAIDPEDVEDWHLELLFGSLQV